MYLTFPDICPRKHLNARMLMRSQLQACWGGWQGSDGLTANLSLSVLASALRPVGHSCHLGEL